jgi:hypothetical protein
LLAELLVCQSFRDIRFRNPTDTPLRQETKAAPRLSWAGNACPGPHGLQGREKQIDPMLVVEQAEEMIGLLPAPGQPAEGDALEGGPGRLLAGRLAAAEIVPQKLEPPLVNISGKALPLLADRKTED